jgi:hypothetical protein
LEKRPLLKKQSPKSQMEVLEVKYGYSENGGGGMQPIPTSTRMTYYDAGLDVSSEGPSDIPQPLGADEPYKSGLQNYRGLDIGTESYGNKVTWFVYDGDKLLAQGTVSNPNPIQAGNAAAQSARDWVDEYIDSQAPPQDDDVVVDDDDMDDDDMDDDKEDNGGGGGGGGGTDDIGSEFVVIGAFAFILLIGYYFMGDGE